MEMLHLFTTFYCRQIPTRFLKSQFRPKKSNLANDPHNECIDACHLQLSDWCSTNKKSTSTHEEFSAKDN